MIFNLAVATDSFPHLLAIIENMRQIIEIKQQTNNSTPESAELRLPDDYGSRYSYYIGGDISKALTRKD